MLTFEEEFYKDNLLLIAGCDEAGRGPVAGPLVVASCILPANFYKQNRLYQAYINDELINDSKKLTAKNREKAYELIIKNAIDFSIIIISVEEIDKDNNIYQTTKKAMMKAFSTLKIIPDLYLTDAMPLDDINNKKVISIIKGDSRAKNIAAASILAKVTRDRIMDELDKKYPEYKFIKNKGYLTKDHINALKNCGYIINIHRKSYAPIKNM